MQGSVGGGRPVSNLTNKGEPEGYSGSGNHLTWATWILSNDRNLITQAYNDLQPRTNVVTDPHLSIFSFNRLTPVIGWPDVYSTPQTCVRLCTVHNLTSTSQPLYSRLVTCVSSRLTQTSVSTCGLLVSNEWITIKCKRTELNYNVWGAWIQRH